MMTQIYFMAGWQKGFGCKAYNVPLSHAGGNARIVGLALFGFFVQVQVTRDA